MMNKNIAWMFGAILTACSSTTPIFIEVRPDASSDTDAASDSGAADSNVDASTDETSASRDAGVSCDSKNGVLACDETITAYCQRHVNCCRGLGTFPTCQCNAMYCSVEACKAAFESNGTDCANYSPYRVCKSKITSCLWDVSEMSCTDVLNGRAQWPISCGDVWDDLPAPDAGRRN